MKFLRKNIGLLYIFLLLIQVVLIIEYLANSLPIPRPKYFYFESVALVFNEHKRVELITYLLGIITLGLFFMGILVGEHKLNSKAKQYALYTLLALTDFKNKRLLLIAFFIYVMLPILFFRLSGAFEGKLVLQIIGLSASIVFPFWNYLLRYKSQQIKYIIKASVFFDKYLIILSYNAFPNKISGLFQKKSFYLFILFIGFLQLGYLFYDPIVNQPKIINEYLTVPEQTIMKDGQKVENNDYLKMVSYKEIDNKEDETDPFSAQKLNNPKLNEWLELNKFEIQWQTLSRFMIHHNSFILIPIGEFERDKNISTINAQYGLGSAWIFEKMLTWSNHLSLDGWLKLSYLFYFLYFGIFVFIVWLITRSLSWTTLIFLLSLAWVNKRGYDFLLLPPGESPWRHFFDIVIVYVLYMFVEKKNFAYYFLALGLGIFSVVINPQIGVMIFMATITAGLFYAYYEKQHIRNILVSSFIALAIAIMSFKFSSSANDLAQYYIDGVIGFPITLVQILKLFIVIIIGYMLFWKVLKDRLVSNYIHILFLLIYSQELILYIVWHYNGDGFKSRAFIYILTVALLVYPFRTIILERWKNYMMVGVASILAIVYLDSVFKVLKSKRQYEKIFDHHATYEWTMDRAHIVSTMNPIYFQNGVDLIQKYSQGQNGIYIVSEYDNLLPFLAHKYSLMPFFDLKWYLITPKELNKSIETLEENKPKYLFVDTGIDRNLRSEVIDSKYQEINYLEKESIWRAQRLKLLNKVFQGVATDYQLIEKGYLISVYKRKDVNETH